MRRALAPLVLGVLILAGCATTKTTTPLPQLTAAQKADAALAAVVPLVETATRASLRQAAQALAANGPGDAGSAAGAPALEADAAALFARLYPEVDTPFTGVTLSPETPAGASTFLRHVLPALALLPSGASIDEPRAAALDSDLVAADALNATSVLPPFLRALLVDDTRRADARALYEEALRRDPGFYPAARELSALIIAGGTAARSCRVSNSSPRFSPRRRGVSKPLPGPSLPAASRRRRRTRRRRASSRHRTRQGSCSCAHGRWKHWATGTRRSGSSTLS